MATFLQKIAHNNTVTLARGDLRALQEVISSERRLVDQTQRLSGEREKASHALREWGNAEGPDLGDVISKVTTLYDYLAKAESAFSEHNGNYRLRFKEIRTKEENLASLRKSRDSLAGRIDAQERKVSKMKEENKDLPTQRQRLRDMQQEMIGLENSVLTEETRLGDFKRSATREALSLKLGAMLELAEKTVIIAELGKLIVDMLPMDETAPGQPRAYYDGYGRTEELLAEAQRCLQDVVFNPAPVTEGFSQPRAQQYSDGIMHPQQHQQSQQYEHQQYTSEGSAHPTNQFDESGIRAVQPAPGSEFGVDHGRATSGQHYPDASYASYQLQQQPRRQDSYASPDPQHQYYGSPGRDQRRTSQILPEQPMPHSGPQLQPLPDFRPLSVVAPPASQHQQSQQSQLRSPAVEGYMSATPMLAPPVQDERYNPDRSSLAYMDEGPLSDAPDGEAGPNAHAREVEDREQREYEEAQAREKVEHEEMQNKLRQAGYGASPYGQEQHHGSSEQEHGEKRTSAEHARSPQQYEEDVERRDMHEALASPAEPSNNQLSPITEASPSTAQLAAGASPAQQFTEPHAQQQSQAPTQPQYPAQEGSSMAAAQPNIPIDFVRPPSAAESRHRYEGGDIPRSYTPVGAPPATATPIYAAHAAPPRVSTDPSSGTASPVPASPMAPPNPPFAGGAFEPRPLTPKGERRPVQIRPQGDALGSKHGDIYVAGRSDSSPYSPAAPRSPYGPTNPAEAGLSGYFPASSTGSNGEQKRTLPAGAFRRGPAASASAGSFAASGYQYDPAAQRPPLGPSESERIAQQWRESAVPLTPEQQLQLQQGAEGIDEVPTPSFDTRPLQVNKNRAGVGAGGVARSGTLPTLMTAPHGRSLGVTNPDVAVDSPSAVGPASPPADAGYASPPPSAGYGSQGQPLSPGAQSGFGQAKFVTRLD
ncbi:hypothetical protein Rhopal_000425-T1 [Rhodotorula paludigena]|uniref:Eisosome component PIL1-domain-containing protein n=1 Tax=Rhodotorula paludigena TaxID=86838 RepID=A0AAV5GCY7_9BASI|nr:hypothetical protein Rhopal_000425-T1 [Rhodotorula paludigena]